MIDTVAIGIAAWIIQDGNYGDFACGDTASFALEFYPTDGLELVSAPPPRQRCLRHIAESRYEIVAEVTHLDEDWWVIDPGIAIFQEDKPPTTVRRGDWVRGNIYIGIDPFFYFERLCRRPGAPPLIYDWIIETIEQDISPLIEIAPRFYGRDPERISWRKVEMTDGWGPDPGIGEYTLHGKCVGGPSLSR
jgi:hypothetical protein